MRRALRYFLCCLFLAAVSPVTALFAQNLVVSGVVTDTDDMPLPGVSVIEKGTMNGVMTDADGSYRILLKNKRGSLVFRLIGFAEYEVKVEGKGTVNVTLEEEATALDEVVVVAYGSQKKATVTGSIASASSEDLVKTSTTNLTQSIGGRVAGVITKTSGGRPGEDDASVYIRGRASYNSSSLSPLVLVDGIERDWAQIDPEDIENLSVLKDASATAIFGVRGANGVILITTKRGMASKPVVDLRATVTMSQPTRLPEKLGSYDYARLKNEALTNVGQTPEYSAYDLEMYRTGENPYAYPDNDYLADMLKDFALKQQYNLTVRGGTPFVRYYASVNYLDEDGIYKTFDNDDYDTNVSFRRIGLRTNLDFSVTKTTTVGVDISGRLEDRHNNGYGDSLFQTLVRTPPNYFNYINPDGSFGGNMNIVNPMAALSHYGYQHSKRNVFEAVVKLNQDLSFITQGLSAKATFGFVSTMKSRRDLNEKPALYKYTADGQYEQIQQEEYISIDASNKGPHTRRFTYDASLNYDRSFNDHKITGLLAFNAIQYYYNANLPTAYLSYVGRVTYSWKDRYLAEINAGYTGSMQFDKSRRYGFFPACSVGWVVSNEPFWNKDARTVTFMKIRMTYGEVGNDKIGSSTYMYMQTYPLLTSNRTSFGKNNNPENRIYEGKIGSNTVGWERSRKANVGLDMKFFRNKLSLTADAFYEYRTDILDYDQTLSSLFGMRGASDSSKGISPENLGKVQNLGFEIEASYKGKFRKLNWYVNGNFSFARNKILEIGESPVTYSYLSQVGRPIGQRFGLICDGFYNTQAEIDALPSMFSSNLKLGDLKYRDVNGDGKIDGYDICPIGKTSVPEIFYGFTLGMDWKGIDASVFFQGAANSDIYVNGYGYWEFTNTSGVLKHHLGRWTEDNKENATYPSLSPSTSKQNHRLSTFWLKNGAYLRLKTAQIGYTLPSRLLKRAKINKLRFYVGGTNLLTFSEFKTYDPESSDGDGTAYPQMKQYNFGVSITF